MSIPLFVSSRRWPPLAALVLLGLGLSLSVVAERTVHAAKERAVQRDFSAAADETARAVRSEIEHTVSALTALRALMQANPEVTPELFAEFTAPMFAADPTLEACGWTPRVRFEQRPRFEAGPLGGGARQVGIFELDGEGCYYSSGVRDEYFPIALAEPHSRLAPWIGFDFASEAVRDETLSTARDTGQVTATDPVRLLFDAEALPGVMIVMPVYADGITPPDIEGRRATLRGFVAAAFFVRPMVEHAVERLERRGMEFSVFDPETHHGADLLYGDPAYQSHGGMLALQPADPLRLSIPISVAGQSWIGVCKLDPEVYRDRVGLAGWTSFWLGLVVTLSVTWYLSSRYWREQELSERNQHLATVISEREAAVERTRASEERFRSMFERHHASMWLIDSESWLIVDANPAAAEFYGYSRDELRGMHIGVINPLPRETLLELFAKTRRDHANHFIVPHRRKSGELRQVEVYSTPIDYQDRRLLFSILHDVTDRLRAESEREAMHAQLVQSQKLESLGLLAGGIAHDFNNLLTAILGNAELALLRAGDNHVMRECLEPLVRTSERAAELTNKLLSYTGKAPSELGSADLSQIVREFTPLLAGLIAKNVELEVEVDSSLPSVLCDTIQVQQVVMNLVLNAAEACGSRPSHVRVATGVFEIDAARLPAWSKSLAVAGDLEPGRMVFIEVRDDGSGIEPAALARIFDPFFTTKFTGRGLGLATVSGVVRAHHGGLEVQSTPGQGSCFRAYFPAQIAPAAARPATVRGVERSGRVVLVVDDEPVVLDVARDILQHYGFEVATASSGRMAVEIMRERQIDLAMLDMTMPEMNGLQTLGALRAIRPDLPAILSTGFSEPEATQQFAGTQLSGFIKKPYAPNVLVAKVREALAGAVSPDV
jgi:PAS domain S-box-containing protein